MRRGWRYVRSALTAARTPRRASSVWRHWRSPCWTGPGECPASSGVSRVIDLPRCSPTDPSQPTVPSTMRMAEQSPIGRVVIIGAGLIGASIGCALSAVGYAVHLRDHKMSHARVAAGLGAGTIDPPVSADVDLVVVAVPPGAIADLVVHSLQQYPNATVTDVGSVKAGVLDTLWQRDVELSRYVGSHPMAGSHHSGPVTAHPGLFVDRTWVVTPHRRSAPESVAQVQAVVQACGAREVIMDVDDHDAAVARVSHLPHLMSVLVAAHVTRVSEPDLLLAGQGLRDVTRIAGSDPLLWEQIVGANSNAVLEELRSIQDQLGLLIKAVEAAPATDE